MKSITEAVKYYAQAAPKVLCVADETAEYTYEEFWKKSCQLADYLSKQGVKDKDTVLVECTQNAPFLMCDMACNIIGAIFVPVEHKASLDRVIMMQEDTEARFFIYENDYALEVKKISYNEILESLSEAESIAPELFNGEDTAEILYTTGTTGKSKGIEMSHAANVALAENIISGTEMKKGNIELLPLPISHSHGLRCVYSNLLNGGSIVLIDGVMKVKQIFELLDKYKITAIDLSPSAALVLLRLSKGRLADYNEQLDYIQIGTAPLPEDTKNKLIQLLPSVRLYNFYGSTESGRTCSLNFNSENKENCIGKPTVNARFIVTDDDRNEIQSSLENPGLLASTGSMNMKGYWKQPALTATIMRNGFIYTNDLGYIDENGYVYVLGRKDDVINYKGIKIAPEEIESAVLKYEGIKDCACVAKPDKSSGQVPVVFVSLKDDREFNSKALLSFLENYVDGNKMPKDVRVVEEIPRTSNGKLQRGKVRELL